MRSLYSGVSGLKIHQTKMDVIGNNIANVNTVGFKSQNVSFSELFYQTTQSATGPNAETSTGGKNAKQIGLGASVAQISTNITAEGGTQSTGNAFDLKINGSSFFVIQKGGSNYYTKAGNFTTDAFGNLVTGSGAYVMGYTAARDPLTGDFVLQNDELRPINLYGAEYMQTDPAQTTEATMTGAINPADEKFNETGYITTTLWAYDSLGSKYGIQMKITNDPTDPTSYTMTPMAVYKGNTQVSGVEAQITGDGVTANSLTIKFSGTTGYVVSPTDTNFQINVTDGSANLDAFQEAINVDFSQLKCYEAESKVITEAGSKDEIGAGKAVGTMIELGIQQDGKIVASYTNGDTAVIGQILVAQFANAAGLQKQGDNLFSSTLNSGDARVSDITALGEDMSSGVIEMSNVDLAEEFTNMIVTQRGFQANSRIITTSDTMLEELINLKR